MSRLAKWLAMAALLGAGSGTELSAQDGVQRRASLFDLGVYAGGAWTTDWFEIGDDSYAPEFGPIFGATATYWFLPTLGVQGGGFFLSSHLAADGNAAFDASHWLVDLDLVFDHDGADSTSVFRSIVWKGGATLVRTTLEGADESDGSLGVNLGVRAPFFGLLGPGVTPFVEAMGRGYTSPVDLGGTADTKFAVTVTLTGGVQIGIR